MKNTHALPPQPTTSMLTSPSDLFHPTTPEGLKLDEQGIYDGDQACPSPVDIGIRNRAIFIGAIIRTSTMGYEGN